MSIGETVRPESPQNQICAGCGKVITEPTIRGDDFKIFMGISIADMDDAVATRIKALRFCDEMCLDKFKDDLLKNVRYTSGDKA
jgi:hypothetical protein